MRVVELVVLVGVSDDFTESEAESAALALVRSATDPTEHAHVWSARVDEWGEVAYRASVESMALDIFSEWVDHCEDDDPVEWVDRALRESVDGSAWVIYNAAHFRVLAHSDNDDAYVDFGVDAGDWGAMAFCAMEADVRDHLYGTYGAPEDWEVPAPDGVEVFEMDADDLESYARDEHSVWAEIYADSLEGSVEEWAAVDEGWYYWSCQPGCLPDSDPVGPFGSHNEAARAAREE